MITLFPHQTQSLEVTKDYDRVAYYLDMGLGKTFVGSEKMKRLGGKVNLVVCQKSKIDDWVQHFNIHYRDDFAVFDLTSKKSYDKSCYQGALRNAIQGTMPPISYVFVINYDLVFRRPELRNLQIDTLMLDESSLIQNENAKRSKFILRLQAKNVILLSGTPTSGKYEKLWSQLNLLGWDISKDLYWKQYVDVEYKDLDGFPLKVVKGYKNVERLKRKLREHGAVFMKSEDVFDLPEQVEQHIHVPITKEYRKFVKDSIVKIDQKELVGDTILTKILYQRQLCGQYNNYKLEAFRDLLDSTNDRLIVFYNFTDELNAMLKICEEAERLVSVVNGTMKCLEQYETNDNSVTFVQYQAGAMGLNLQKANKIIYFSLPLGKGSCGLWEQSKKRIHRIGQNRTCFYYYLLCKNSIEMKNLESLKLGKDLTDDLFEMKVN